ncbi:hypothetical protein [Albidovulum sp.]|uniref:hypothetical protein n=1 Tax=Albidovulum sp. TaxID=1872424 RepID=UPI003D7CE45D
MRFAGAGLAALVAAAHVFVGTFDTLVPLLDSDLALPVKGTFHACWHFISIVLIVSVWAFAKGTALARPIAWLWIAFGICFVAAGIFGAGIDGIVAVPQWVLLVPVGVLVLITQTGPTREGR